MKRKRLVLLGAVLLLLAVSTVFAITIIWQDNFNDNTITGWTVFRDADTNEVNQRVESYSGKAGYTSTAFITTGQYFLFDSGTSAEVQLISTTAYVAEFALASPNLDARHSIRIYQKTDGYHLLCLSYYDGNTHVRYDAYLGSNAGTLRLKREDNAVVFYYNDQAKASDGWHLGTDYPKIIIGSYGSVDFGGTAIFDNCKVYDP